VDRTVDAQLSPIAPALRPGASVLDRSCRCLRDERSAARGVDLVLGQILTLADYKDQQVEGTTAQVGRWIAKRLGRKLLIGVSSRERGRVGWNQGSVLALVPSLRLALRLLRGMWEAPITLACRLPSDEEARRDIGNPLSSFRSASRTC
jgi:hypothetical protein